MASIICGHCKNIHTSIAQVRVCSVPQDVNNLPSADEIAIVRGFIELGTLSLAQIRTIIVNTTESPKEETAKLAERWLIAFDQIVAESSAQGAAAVQAAVEAAPAPAPAPKPVTEAGMYRKPNGVVYRVRISKKSGFPYAEKMVPGLYGKVKFEYTAYEIKTITADMRMTVEEAGKVGAQYGACCVCGRTLTDTTKNMSVQKGIGPVCAGKV